MNRVGIFGGSFDPPTKAHYLMASAAADALSLDILLFVPAYQALLKDTAPVGSVEHRLAMLELLAQLVPNSKIDSTEIDKRRQVSTWETTQAIMSEHGPAEYHLIIGADQAAQFQRWENWQQLLAAVNVIWFTRTGYVPSAVLTGKGVEIALDEDVSSSIVRSMINKGQDVSDLLMPEILTYLTREGLYQ